MLESVASVRTGIAWRGTGSSNRVVRGRKWVSPGQRSECRVSIGSWSDKYDDLSSDGTRVLNAVIMLRLADLHPTELAAALDTTESDVAAKIADLRQAGWVESTPSGGDVLVDSARIWLTYDADLSLDPDGAADVATRIVRYHIEKLDLEQRSRDDVVRWVAAHRTGVVGAIRASVRAGRHQPAIDLAMAAWRVAGDAPDSSWWQELAKYGQAAAMEQRDEDAIVSLLTISADVYEARGLLVEAETQWGRVARLGFDHGHHDRVVSALTSLIRIFRKGHRPESVMDALLELADAHQVAGDQIARAEALAMLATEMFAADRTSAAETYIARANEVLAEVDQQLVPAQLRGALAEQWGRALWMIGQPIRARRCFAQALDAFRDVDPVAAERVGALIAIPIDTPTLPTE